MMHLVTLSFAASSKHRLQKICEHLIFPLFVSVYYPKCKGKTMVQHGGDVCCFELQD